MRTCAIEAAAHVAARHKGRVFDVGEAQQALVLLLLALLRDLCVAEALHCHHVGPLEALLGELGLEQVHLLGKVGERGGRTLRSARLRRVDASAAVVVRLVFWSGRTRRRH